jgi:hypothetical protein
MFKWLWCTCREDVGDTQPLVNGGAERRRLGSAGSRCDSPLPSLGLASGALGVSHAMRSDFALSERCPDLDAFTSAILSPTQFCNLAKRVLPVNSQRGVWRRKCSVADGGAAMVTFQHALQSTKEVLLVIETERGCAFGAFLDAEVTSASHEIEWSKDSCLWELAENRATTVIHRWAGRNDRIVQCGKCDWSMVRFSGKASAT